MKIKFVEVENFRRLKSTRIHFGNENTIFAGPNNSGKTTAMSALIKFLNREEKILVDDFTLSLHEEINRIGRRWETECINSEITLRDVKIDEDEIDNIIEEIDKLVPKLDIWLEVNEGEEKCVERILPTLNWTTEDNLGIRIALDIGNKLQDLYKDYIQSRINYKELKKIDERVELWPENLIDFLYGRKESNLNKYFSKKVYILDPSQLTPDSDIIKNNNLTKIQETSRKISPLPLDVLKELFKVDIIGAQRGFKDDEGNILSKQLHRYYSKHLTTDKLPNKNDLNIQRMQQEADSNINHELRLLFESAINELNALGYPAFSDPKLDITIETNMGEQIERSTRLTNKVFEDYCLPESFNGLGYQNLIFMTFRMIEFRDIWMQKGERYKEERNSFIPKLHLVLVEEPEAFLHVQVQEVFLKKAYATLRNGVSKEYSTQLIISTHSSNIVNGAEFENVRYFKKQRLEEERCPISSVVNMHNVFSDGKLDINTTSRFVKRYIKSAHCDLFFADAIILVEGRAESILLPYFINNHFKELESMYITILEVGGSHMHRLRSLIEILDVPCLIITDIDAGEIGCQHKSTMATWDDNCTTTNSTIRFWLRDLEGKKNENGKAKFEELSTIIDLSDGEKHPEHSITGETCSNIKFAYQTEVSIVLNDLTYRYIPNTFEDALIAKNIEYLLGAINNGYLTNESIIKPLQNLGHIKDNEDEFKNKLYGIPVELTKANFALELFYLEELNKIDPPDYIIKGLDWLVKRVIGRDKEVVSCMEVVSHA